MPTFQMLTENFIKSIDTSSRKSLYLLTLSSAFEAKNQPYIQKLEQSWFSSRDNFLLMEIIPTNCLSMLHNFFINY